MKITFEFDTNAEDFIQEELDLVYKARDYSCALWDIKQYLRSQWKYTDKPDDIDTIYDKVNEILVDYKLDI